MIEKANKCDGDTFVISWRGDPVGDQPLKRDDYWNKNIITIHVLALSFFTCWQFWYLGYSMQLVANFANTKWCKKTTEILANGYSSESTKQELCNEYRNDRV